MTPLEIEAIFEFDPHPLAAAAFSPAGVTRISPRTYALNVDHRPVPFKLLQQHETLDRPILTLIHGMGVTHASYLGLFPFLFPTHDLLLVDYNSFTHPASPWPAGGVSLKLMAHSIAEVMEFVNGFREPASGEGKARAFSLLSHSLGGGLALLLTLSQPALVDKTIFINPAVYPMDLPSKYSMVRIPLIGELLMLIMPAEAPVEGISRSCYSKPDKMPAHLRRLYTQNMTRVNRFRLMDTIRNLPANARDSQELARRIPEHAHPTLVLWGEGERLIDPTTGERLRKDWPHAKHVWFGHLAHSPQEESPEELGPVVAEFLKGQELGARS